MRHNHVSAESFILSLAQGKDERAIRFEQLADDEYGRAMAAGNPVWECCHWDEMLAWEAHARMWANWPTIYHFRYRPVWAVEASDGGWVENAHPLAG